MTPANPNPRGPGEWPNAKVFSAFLALGILAVFAPVLAGQKSFFFRDFGFFGYPLAAYHRQSFWAGEMPLWNPYNNCGLPFLAQWNTLVLYPGSVIYLLLPLPWSLNLFCLFHFFLGGLGMYFLARAWTGTNLGAAVAGLAYTFGGVMLCSLKWPNNIAALGLMPWVLLAVERGCARGGRPWLLAILVAAAQMLAGAPEVILLTWTFAAAMLARELAEKSGARSARVARFTGLVAMVACLAAAQLLPFLDLLAHSQRDRRFGGAEWAMPAWGWANFLLPLFRTFPSYHGAPAQPEQYWISTYYVCLGVAVPGLACLLRGAGGRQKALFWLAVFCLVLSLGDSALVYKYLRQAFPPFGLMRFPIKFVVLPALIFPLLAAFAVKALREGTTSPKILARWQVGAALLAGTLLAADGFGRAKWGSASVSNGLARLCFLFLIPAALARATAAAPGAKKWGAAALALVWLDGFSHAPNQNPTVDPWVFERGAPQFAMDGFGNSLGGPRAMISPEAYPKLDHLSLDTPEEDMAGSRLSLYCDSNLIDLLPKVDGFYSLYFPEMALIESILYSRTNNAFPRLMEFLGVGRITAPGKTREWSHVSGSSPWLTGGQQPIPADKATAIQGLTDDNFNPLKVVYVEENARLSPKNGATVVMGPTELKPHRVWIGSAESALPFLIVHAQAFYHCWKAYVDGKPAPLFRVNFAFQGLEVPSGRHSVEFRYVDTAFREGMGISGGALLIWIALWLREKKRAPNSQA